MSIVKTRAHPTLDGPIMTYTTIVRKMKGQKTGRLLCGGDSVGFAAFLCAVSDDTQQALHWKKSGISCSYVNAGFL